MAAKCFIIISGRISLAWIFIEGIRICILHIFLTVYKECILKTPELGTQVIIRVNASPHH